MEDASASANTAASSTSSSTTSASSSARSRPKPPPGAKLVHPDEAGEAEELVLVPVDAGMQVRLPELVVGVERGHVDDRAVDAVRAVEGASVDWRFVLTAFLLLLLELGCTISQEC